MIELNSLEKDLLARGKLIDAVKNIRVRLGVGLVDAKGACDAWKRSLIVDTNPRDRATLTVKIGTVNSMTTTGKRYAVSMVGYIICSCGSANHPKPGYRIGQCKHTDALETQLSGYHVRRENLKAEIKRLSDELNRLDASTVSGRLPESGRAAGDSYARHSHENPGINGF